MQDLRIDSHKLIYHTDRVNRWLEGKDVYPIYVEISPSGTCNHRCIFCAFDYLDYEPQFIDKSILKRALSDMAKHGVKSVMFSGEGEPFLHKDMVEFILYAKRVGLDVACAINGILFSPNIARKCLRALTWIKVSVNAGSKKAYAKIHGCKGSDFDRVIFNLKEAVKIRKRNKYKCSIGAQLVLLPENLNEPPKLAKVLKNIGVDYLVIKPFIKHPQSPHDISRSISSKELLELEKKLARFNSEKFKVYFRRHSFIKLNEPRGYSKCLGLPFFCEITSNGNIYTCGPFLGEDDFCYGNIYKNSFPSIWKGKKRKKILNMVSSRLDVRKCMKNCRLDEVNNYLWELKNLPPHVNFI